MYNSGARIVKIIHAPCLKKFNNVFKICMVMGYSIKPNYVLPPFQID
jgi:hypothetical protein